MVSFYLKRLTEKFIYHADENYTEIRLYLRGYEAKTATTGFEENNDSIEADNKRLKEEIEREKIRIELTKENSRLRNELEELRRQVM